MNSKRDREELRPLIRDTRLYHASDRPDGCAPGWRRVLVACCKGVVYVFRGSIADQPEHRFVVARLVAGKRYRLHFEGSSVADNDMVGSDRQLRRRFSALARTIELRACVADGEQPQANEAVTGPDRARMLENG